MKRLKLPHRLAAALMLAALASPVTASGSAAQEPIQPAATHQTSTARPVGGTLATAPTPAQRRALGAGVLLGLGLWTVAVWGWTRRWR